MKAQEKMNPHAKFDSELEGIYVKQIRDYEKTCEPALRKDLNNMQKKIV